MRAGDLSARDEMLRAVSGRLERLARKMLGRFPGVRRWADTDDVLQNAVLRLLRALPGVQPDSMRAFFGLAAEQIRRELLDLHRHFFGPQGVGAKHASDGGLNSPAPEPSDRTDDPRDLDDWRAFHEEVARLPAEEREVMDLLFYHDMTQAEAAELLQVSVRTVQRRQDAALLRLHHLLKDAP
jgi:RNA polymerase sigma-70 factor (ECF subfamily)